jgi:hypothetical protein
LIGGVLAVNAAQIGVDTSPGTASPPGTLGGYSMIGFPPESQPEFSLVSSVLPPPSFSGSLALSQFLEVDQVGSGWATWSHGYSGTVYYNMTDVSGVTALTMTLPANTLAFYFYVEPNNKGTFNFTAESGSVTVPLSVAGNGSAEYVGFYSENGVPLTSITLDQPDGTAAGYAVGEFGINGVAPVPETGSCLNIIVALASLTMFGWRCRKRLSAGCVGALLLALAGGVPGAVMLAGATPPSKDKVTRTTPALAAKARANQRVAAPVADNTAPASVVHRPKGSSVTVKVVPWVASDVTIPHDTYPGATITLKGTVAGIPGDTLNWTWDFGDGSPVASGTVSDNYAIEATHAYSGAPGTLYTARLTVIDQNNGDQDSKPYYVLLSAQSLSIQVNVAIDEALWRLHKEMTRWNDGTYDLGNWASARYLGVVSGLGYPCLDAENIAAFETQGHLEIGNPDDPYTETVQRGLRRLFEEISAAGIAPLKSIQSGPGGTYVTVTEDVSGSGLGIYGNYGDTLYQGGMLIDCIIASGTPNTVTVTGGAGVVGRTYAAVVQDMVDWYLYAQYTALPGGGWRYNPGDYPDNSVCQWAAIGMIPAEREWNLTVPQWTKDWDAVWLLNTQDEGWWNQYGALPYQPGNYAWGPFATTPSGMVQMCMDHIGRGSVGWPNWDAAETYMRNNWDSGWDSGPKGYCYGLFSFVKSMLLHWDIVNNVQSPIVMLQSSTPGVLPLDWYGAQAANGDPSDGVAITLVNKQQPGGYWWYSGWWVPNGGQPYFHTAWCTMMLSKTIFTAGGPVAVPVANPNPALAGQTITLDGSASFDKAVGHHIVKWEWDLTGDEHFTVSGPVTTTSFPTLGTYPVRLRVTDDSSPPLTAEATVNVLVNIPPIPPTADAGGPYVFCPQATPWFLDGRKSVEPDQGKSEPGCPPDTLSYAWDFSGGNLFQDSTSPTPDVTSYFQGKGPGTYVVQLKVTDTTATSFPSSGLGNLSSVASATVVVLPADNPVCACVTLSYTLDGKNVNLSWTAFDGAASYAVYRSEVQGGPYLLIGTSTTTTYTDMTAVSQQTYYYVVRPRALNDNELCQSNEEKITPACGPPVITCTHSPNFNSKYYYRLTANNDCYDEVAIKIYIGDTLTPGFVAGPYMDEDVVRLSKGASASVAPGVAGSGVTAIITVKGEAAVWGVAPLGETSTPILVNP